MLAPSLSSADFSNSYGDDSLYRPCLSLGEGRALVIAVNKWDACADRAGTPIRINLRKGEKPYAPKARARRG